MSVSCPEGPACPGGVGLSGEDGGVCAEGAVVAVLCVGAVGAIVVGVGKGMNFHAGGLSGGMVLPLLRVSGWMCGSVPRLVVAAMSAPG